LCYHPTPTLRPCFRAGGLGPLACGVRFIAMSDDDSKGFTVKDRRHFTADGGSREARTAEAPAVAEPTTAVPAMPPEGSLRGDSVDFSSFLLSLAAQAGALLAGGSPETNDSEARAGARQIISVLEMLQGKTEGRRSADETRLLEGLLFELRMAYVEASGGVKP
jgi:hypothetical protein